MNTTNIIPTVFTKREISDILEFLSELVSFETVRGEQTENAPFGEANLACLECYLQKAQEFGFETKNVDGYCGHVEFPAQNVDAKLFGVLGHLDVVPAGEGWETDPFTLSIVDEKILGRGVQDDKGPMAIALFALKKLKDSGFAPNKTIRLIVGCNEENGSTCIQHYFDVAKEKMPDVGISPDSDFPAIHSEKGIVWVGGELDLQIDGFESIRGGEKMNMVPYRCETIYTGSITTEKLQASGFAVENVNGGRKLSTIGVNAHGSMPAMGENAISKTIHAIGKLCEMGEIHPCNQTLQKLEFLFKLAKDTNGTALGIASQDEVSGALTANLGVATLENGKFSFGIDIRYPNCSCTQEIEKQISALGKDAGVALKQINSQHALFVHPDDPLVKLCVSAYNRHTGENAKSKKIGGGTYARELKYGIAVGPVFDGVPTTIHNKNEHMTMPEFEKTAEILYEIMKEIASENFEI